MNPQMVSKDRSEQLVEYSRIWTIEDYTKNRKQKKRKERKQG